MQLAKVATSWSILTQEYIAVGIWLKNYKIQESLLWSLFDETWNNTTHVYNHEYLMKSYT